MALKLKSQIICRIVIPTVLFLMAIGIVSLALLWPNIDTWTNRGQAHIVTEETKNLVVRTENLRQVSATVFGEIANEVDHLAEYAENIQQGNFNIANFYPSYYGASSDPNQEPPGGHPPGGLDTNGKNKDYSLWFNKFNQNPLTNINLQNSSVLDNVYRALYSGNDNYIALYIGFENDGMSRLYPYERVDGYISDQYTCASNGAQITGYDPRCRG